MTSVITSRRHGVNGSLAVKAPCKSATTANITLSGEQTIDGVALVDGDRVLVKDQTTGSENGIYAVSTSTWSREPDWDGNRDIATGTHTYVTDGSTTSGGWRITTANPIAVGTTDITFDFSELDPTLRSQLADTSTDDGTKGFHLVNYPPLSGETGIENHAFARNNLLRFIPISLHDAIRARTDTTDLSTYIQNANDSMPTAGGTIIAPIGKYTHLTQINLSMGVSIEGEGYGTGASYGTEFNCSTGTNHGFSIENAAPTSIRAGIIISKLALVGNSTGDGIRIAYSSYVKVHDIFVRDFRNDIRFIGDCYLNSVYDSIIATAVDYGIYFEEGTGTGVNSNFFTRNQYDSNTKVHIYVASPSSYGNEFTHSNFNGGGVALWGTQASYQNTFSFNAIETSDSNRSVYIGLTYYDGTSVSAPNNWHVEGNQFTGSGTPTYDLELVSASGSTVIHNKFHGTPGTAFISVSNVGSGVFENNKNAASGMKPMFESIASSNTSRFIGSTSIIKAFADEDATPSVKCDQATGGVASNGNEIFKTANTLATTITDFDEGYIQQRIKVLIEDANTTIDFTASGLKGNAGVDWSPGSGDHMDCQFDGTDWFCVVSDNTA